MRDLVKPSDHGLNLIVTAKQEDVEVKHTVLQVLELPRILERRHQKPEEGHIKHLRKESDFMYVELAPAITEPGALQH